jgi:eukaryotic-like serine/threonine-protein kinase
MNPDQWKLIKGIFNSALELPQPERPEFVLEACGEDAEMRRHVEELLAAHAEAETFIEDSPAAYQSELLRAVKAEVKAEIRDGDAPLAGRRVRAYRLVREVGRGGMGAVYLAVRDDEFKQRVAVKLIRRGMDTDDVVRRFRRERQVLAALDHPHIARLLDGGTTEDGLPYFVMEYVEGWPITEYADAKRLTTPERLKLFAEVCAAVHHAHQNLVVHRDLKPSNIIVTADGTVKLLDFGIAKLLNPELSGLTIDPTATALRMMTPEYASPEQVRGEKITTASDIYSLGVVLYELLAGERPYRLTSRQPHEILRIVCEQEPERPSTVASRQLSRRAAARAQPPRARALRAAGRGRARRRSGTG